jgi:hypothetical protein
MKTMNYFAALKKIYPGLTKEQVELHDHGQGVVITKWSYNAPVPDLSSLSMDAKCCEDKITSAHDGIAYLKKTDWYVIRKYEKGTPIPKNVESERKAARNSVSLAKDEGLISDDEI